MQGKLDAIWRNLLLHVPKRQPVDAAGQTKVKDLIAKLAVHPAKKG